MRSTYYTKTKWPPAGYQASMPLKKDKTSWDRAVTLLHVSPAAMIHGSGNLLSHATTRITTVLRMTADPRILFQTID